jgi:uncharacterized protein YbbK (DUF523 family)
MTPTDPHREAARERAGATDVDASAGPPAGGAAAKPPLLVSACLLGVACNHEGRSSRRPHIEALAARFTLIPVCPEVLGGLTTPRPAAERQGERVVNVDGLDVTEEYGRGAAAALDVARAAGATRAVLKARSPSCGASAIYDGTFSRTLAAGAGVTAALLCGAGITVVSDEDEPPDPG